MERQLRVQGRVIGERELHEVRQLVDSSPGWSRFRLSVALAAMWGWRSANGSLKDMAARSLMRKLHARGLLRLPAPRGEQPRPREPERWARGEVAPSAVEGPLTDLAPVRIEVVSPGTAGYRTWAGYLRAYHYLGYRGPVGENLSYLVRDRQGRELACLLFGAAAWRTRPRDRFIGWDDATRARNLALLANNSRFLILPAVRVPHLASHVLARVGRRLSTDWQAKYGHPLYLVETYVDRARFAGTCYRAANWLWLGPTQGRSRQDRGRTLHVPVKDLYVYPLTPHFRERLCHGAG